MRNRFVFDSTLPARPLVQPPAVGSRAAGELGRKRFVFDSTLPARPPIPDPAVGSRTAGVQGRTCWLPGRTGSSGREEAVASPPAARSVAAKCSFPDDWEARLMAAAESEERAALFVLKHKPVVGSMIKAGSVGISKLLGLGAPECVVDGLANEANTSPEEWKEWGQTKETVKKVKAMHAARPKAPYLDDQGRLRIPCDCEQKYRWWQDGQSPFETALELGASDEELEHHVSETLARDDWRRWQEIKAQRVL